MLFTLLSQCLLFCFFFYIQPSSSSSGSKLVPLTYRTHKAGVMPGESQSIQELIPRLDGEVTPVAVGPKQVVVV